MHKRSRTSPVTDETVGRQRVGVPRTRARQDNKPCPPAYWQFKQTRCGLTNISCSARANQENKHVRQRTGISSNQDMSDMMGCQRTGCTNLGRVPYLRNQRCSEGAAAKLHPGGASARSGTCWRGELCLRVEEFST